MYCRITYKWSADRKRTGDYVLGNKTLSIGQTVSCEVSVPEYHEYEPEVFASIILSDDKKEWILVRRTDGYDVHVNGERVGIAAVLSHGDEICFSCRNGGGKLLETVFEICKDGFPDAKGGIVYGHGKRNTVALWITSVIGLIAACLAVFVLLNDDGLLRHEDFSEYENCVYQIVADSVFLVETVDGREYVVESVGLEHVEKGTCFLTEDSLIVTARHCVEPWINDDKWIGTADMDNMSDALRLAVEAETRNHDLREERYSVRSRCVISCGDERLVYYSSDFSMNRSRDKILGLGDFDSPLYMRTIVPIASRRDMELGDFAYVKTDRKGMVSLAAIDEMRMFDDSGNKDIVVMGYPLNDNHTDRLNLIDGQCQGMEFNDAGTGLEGCIQISGGITHGYSGSPVFARIKGKGIGGGRLKVIGLVSKYDTNAQFTTFWAVPATEVAYLRSKGDRIQDDTFMYRR